MTHGAYADSNHGHKLMLAVGFGQRRQVSAEHNKGRAGISYIAMRRDMGNDKISVFIADDSEMVVDAIMALTASDPSIEIVGHCGNGLEVLDQVRAIQPKALVLDISLPGLNGLEVCRLLKAQVPATSVLMLSMHTNERCVLDALRRGASAYLGKESVATELCEAIHAISQGNIYLGQGIPRSVLDLIKEDCVAASKAT